MTRPLRAVLTASLAAVCFFAWTAAADARTVWLCKPGLKDNPCTGSLNATVITPTGATRGIERTRIARKAPIDCFYVYPTVSGQEGPNATRARDPEVRAIARFQASRFSQACRVYAPVYRQLTLAAIGNPQIPAAAALRAYSDVRAAWLDYLRNHNRGRGVVLIGHSQGTFMLRRLITAEIDRKRAVRRRVVSALLTGGDVTVAKNRRTGGDFRNIPACTSEDQIGCVVAYATYNEIPPAESRFGRTSDPDLEVLCTNPASLDGGSGILESYVRTDEFPGLLGALVEAQVGPLPDVSTRWVVARGHYSARCSSAGGANVLLVSERNGARRYPPQPDANWGLHLGDMNLPLGNLTDLVRRQRASYLARR